MPCAPHAVRPPPLLPGKLLSFLLWHIGGTEATG